ncbi:ATP-binding protein [Selenomonas ruminantium]|uniref:DNA replication protein DnaC n=1 Tax=Selenomonas ruminantium TaxID=971 RepID=A0A1I0VJ59_SELRU|nr:ATP-binding protein [Selenomonas ruminantium]SFA76361.1 DNA replication protein DnaC [Selenomonas ruminantium]
MKLPAGTDDNKRQLLEWAGIYKRYQAVTFENIEKRGLPGDKNIRENYKQVKQYASQLDYQVKHGFGLILSGHYGAMKTTMAVAVLRQWLDTGHNGLIVPMCSLMDNLYTMRIMNREEFAKYDQRIRSTPLLVIDDLGAENNESWILSKIDSIITERYNKMLPVIVTTNLTKKELEGTYSARVMDRLRNISTYLVFDAESQRRTKSNIYDFERAKK